MQCSQCRQNIIWQRPIGTLSLSHYISPGWDLTDWLKQVQLCYNVARSPLSSLLVLDRFLINIITSQTKQQTGKLASNKLAVRPVTQHKPPLLICLKMSWSVVSFWFVTSSLFCWASVPFNWRVKAPGRKSDEQARSTQPSLGPTEACGCLNSLPHIICVRQSDFEKLDLIWLACVGVFQKSVFSPTNTIASICF